MTTRTIFLALAVGLGFASSCLAENTGPDSTPPVPTGGGACAPEHYANLLEKVNGPTVFTVAIDETGKATNVTVDQSSGSNQLDDTAVKCVMSKWRFEPATDHGNPIASTHQYKIVWKMN